MDGIIQPLLYEGVMLPQRLADTALHSAASDCASDSNKIEYNQP